MKFCIVIMGFLIMSLSVRSQKLHVDLSAQNEWKNGLCADFINADSLGYICMASGCEGKYFFKLNKYHYSNDTLYIDPFNFILQPPFLEIRKNRNHNADTSSVTFFSPDGKKVEPFDSSFLLKVFTGNKIYYEDCPYGEFRIRIPKNKFRCIELMQLSRAFGNPVVFWMQQGYNYRIVINLPLIMLNSHILGSMNFRETYLLIKNNKVVFPEQDFELNIIRKTISR